MMESRFVVVSIIVLDADFAEDTSQEEVEDDET